MFVVNEKTFSYHLKYLFAGTTAGKTTAGNYKERHYGLLADIARTRKGDKVVFYVEQVGFFGIFEIDSDYPLYEPLDGWLQKELDIPLIYRVRIRPAEVYDKPVSEWEAIDKLPEKSRDIRWSLLYRKLAGKRGCSYMFPHEAEGLLSLIRNKGRVLTCQLSEKEFLCYEEKEKSISLKESNERFDYKGSNDSPNDQIASVKTECELQAWFCWNLGRNETLDRIAPRDSLVWFANEVYAGSGNQKMDILCIVSRGDTREYRVLELKKDKPETEKLVEQTRRYVWWLNSYQRVGDEKIRVYWIARGFEQDSFDHANRLKEEERQNGLIGIHMLKWKQENGNVSLAPFEDYSQKTLWEK
ncbi:MAG: EVE domain-containing protein [Armatimonadetes bacterium]|nr:EVE domain-containing protein [Armatimonadota bacterium]